MTIANGMANAPTSVATVFGAMKAAARTTVAGIVAALAILAMALTLGCSRNAEIATPDPNDAAGKTTAEAAEHSEQDAPAEEEPAAVETEGATAPFDLAPASLQAIGTFDTLGTFSLSGGAEPELSAAQRDAIEAAVAAVEAQGGVGFVMVDAQTGNGIAYHADTPVYGASSFKALYGLYLCQTLLETGAATLDTWVYAQASDANSGYGWGGSYTLGELINAAIVYSDNGAYGSLRLAYDGYNGADYDAWASALGAGDALYDPMSWYPTYSARTSTILWAELRDYLAGGTQGAAALRDALAQTETSFLRDACAAEGLDAATYTKAGWIADGAPYNSICDAGIIEADGHAYIVSVMSSMPDSEANRALFGELAAALLSSRETLA